jgi:tRNA-intron endonuclease
MITEKIIAKAELLGDKAIVSDSTLKGLLVEKGFGEGKGSGLILDLFEAIYLAENDKIEVIDHKGKALSPKKLCSAAAEKDKSFYSKYTVYCDLKEKGYCVKTGLKFGFDFRVYPKGKKMGESHTQYVIHIATESEKLSLPSISRMTRLSGNLHTTALIAVVDREDSVNYYSIGRLLL